MRRRKVAENSSNASKCGLFNINDRKIKKLDLETYLELGLTTSSREAFSTNHFQLTLLLKILKNVSIAMVTVIILILVTIPPPLINLMETFSNPMTLKLTF